MEQVWAWLKQTSKQDVDDGVYNEVEGGYSFLQPSR